MTTATKTPQEIFDITLNHLRKQGKASYGVLPGEDDQDEPREGCLYRGPGGTMCAAGVHIPDDKYTTEFEDVNIATGHGELAELVDEVGLREHIQLLLDLQHAHDDRLTKSVAAWEEQMERIAVRHGLTYTAPGEVK